MLFTAAECRVGLVSLRVLWRRRLVPDYCRISGVVRIVWCRVSVVVMSFSVVQRRNSVGVVSCSVSLASFLVVWCRISVRFVLFSAAQCRISVGIVSNCVGLVEFPVVWCRISLGLVSFSSGLLSDCRINVV